MDQAKYTRRQAICNKRDEIALLERDLASKKRDLAQLESEDAAAVSCATLKFAETAATDDEE